MNAKVVVLCCLVGGAIFGVCWSIGYSAGRQTCPDVVINNVYRKAP